jgi:hypothetical protein
MYYTEYMPKSKKNNGAHRLILGILAFCVIGLLVFLYVFIRGNQLTDVSKDIPAAEKVVYQETLPFNPNTLTDITEATEGTNILDSIASPRERATIPAKSKITLSMPSYCLDGNKSSPESEGKWPNLFSYEKVDMPMYSDVVAYVNRTSDVNQGLVQEIIWKLAPDSQTAFDDLSDEQQALVLAINPNAKNIIDSYEYFNNFDIKYFQFPKTMPKQVIAQNIPGTKLYTKAVSFAGYSETNLEVYNPTDVPQTFYLKDADGGMLTTIPMFWEQTVNADLFTSSDQEDVFRFMPQVFAQEKKPLPYTIVSGKNYELLEDGAIKTGKGGYLDIRLENGARIWVNQNTVFTFSKIIDFTWPEELYLNAWRKWHKLLYPNSYQRTQHLGGGASRG